MRETRLFDYASSETVNSFPLFAVTVPASNLRETAAKHPASWAGVVGTVSWRVENSNQLILEPFLDATPGIRLSFSSPISARPLVRRRKDGGEGSVEIFLSCHSDQRGCTLLHLTANVSSSSGEPAFNEVARLLLTDLCVNAISGIGDHVILGLSDGRCALADTTNTTSGRVLMHAISTRRFARVETSVGDSDSVVSHSSFEGAPSQRSVASSLSMSLVNRIFRSPNRNPTANGTNSEFSQESSVANPPRRSLRQSLRLRAEREDPVIALAELRAGENEKAFVSMHASGKLYLFTWDENKYTCKADSKIPAKFSNGNVDQFLLTASPGSAIAVVMADEDPNADSLSVFTISSYAQDSGFSLSCVPFAKRDGPIDRIIAVLPTRNEVVIATETGLVTILVKSPINGESAPGLPREKLWTIVDDVDQPFGLGKSLEKAFPSPRVSLSMAHRFTPYAIAKALRFETPENVTRLEIDSRLRELHANDEEDSSWMRVKIRAEQVVKQEDLKVRDVFLVEEVGIVIARRSIVSVLRSLTEIERRLVNERMVTITNTISLTNRAVIHRLASHGSCQELAARYFAGVVPPEMTEKFLFIMKLSLRLREDGSGVPLTDIIVGNTKEMNMSTAEHMDYATVVNQSISAISPSSILLRRLMEGFEVSALGLAADQCINTLSISSLYASGLSWLFQHRVRSSEINANDEENVMSDYNVLREDEDLDQMLDRAYGCMVQGNKWCQELSAKGDTITETMKEDARCAIDLARIATIRAIASDRSVPPMNQQAGILLREDPSSIFEPGTRSQTVWDRLGFWLMERAARLFETSGAAKYAASCALEGMFGAPDREKLELMRSSAFSRFVDAGELEAALATILCDPFPETIGLPATTTMSESGALRDAVGLLVNAAADNGKLQWLADFDLPGPLKIVCGHALERRARAAEALAIPDALLRSGTDMQVFDNEDGKAFELNDGVSDYEIVYSWHVSRGDNSSAASAALEWAERVNDEGMNTLRETISGSNLNSSQQQARLVLLWIQVKSTALSYAASAANRQTSSDKYVVRSKFSRITKHGDNCEDLLVHTSWISRRLLLAFAQTLCLTMMLSQLPSNNGNTRDIHYLIAHGASFLSDGQEGVRWAISALQKKPTFDNLLLCAEIAMAWREEIGDSILMETIRSAAAIAARKDSLEFEYDHLRELLSSVESTASEKSCSPQWYFMALESALGTSGGSTTYPKWLVDAAAWGSRLDGEEEEEGKGNYAGDFARVALAFLHNNRPFDAAKLLLQGLEKQVQSENELAYVSYSAIDATIDILGRIAEDYPGADELRSKLCKETAKYTSSMRDKGRDELANLEAMGNGNDMEFSENKAMDVGV